MKKIFNLIASFVLLAGFSACNKDGSDKPGLPPAPVPTVNYKGLTFISSGNSTVCLAKVGLRMKSHWNTAPMSPIGIHIP